MRTWVVRESGWLEFLRSEWNWDRRFCEGREGLGDGRGDGLGDFEG